MWSDLDNIDLVLALGSSWSTYWPEVHEATEAERDLMRRAVERDIPILGICFGGQQLSTVLGGSVSRSDTPEIGWCTIAQITEVAKNEKLCPKVLASGPWMQWHYDRFSVPAGATALADSPVGPQAMVFGRHLGLQFHPEVTESMVRHWSSGDGGAELQEVGISRAELLAETARRVDDSFARCGELVDWFVNVVAQGNLRQPL